MSLFVVTCKIAAKRLNALKMFAVSCKFKTSSLSSKELNG